MRKSPKGNIREENLRVLKAAHPFRIFSQKGWKKEPGQLEKTPAGQAPKFPHTVFFDINVLFLNL